MKIIEHTLRDYPRPYLADYELEILMGGSSDSRYGKVKRLIAHGKLLPLRRGRYCITEVMGHKIKPHAFELAHFIYSPSYISLESALSFHQLIPEAVYTTTSVCSKRSKEFHTPLGIFSYLHLPLKSFYTEVELIHDNPYQFLMAKPWKAICDYVFCYKKEWDSLEPLFQSLRIDEESLPILPDEEMDRLDDYYKHRRLSRFLKGIKKEMTHFRGV